MKNVVFVDRDGTIIREPRDKQIDSLEKLEFLPGAIAGLKLLADAGFTLVMVSNQDGLGTPRYPKAAFTLVQKKVLGLLAGEGIAFDRVFICPHRKGDGCACRKPATGLVAAYLRSVRIDRARSFVLGDRETDVAFARNLGVGSVRLTRQASTRATYAASDLLDACRFIASSMRTAAVSRTTRETAVSARVALDGTGRDEIATGIGFFDHMLAQLARHSGIDIALRVTGDLHVDEHHTVEDAGIVLGRSIRLAMGNKRGIERFAAPLDEALAQVTLDLSGRSLLSFRCEFRRERVGDLPTELVEDFFRAFADGLRATIHITCRGRNEHHMIEAIFKSTARALKTAVAVDPRGRGRLPSTKGVL
jgi:imidazoleglycerol-phosphate dehydratase/histidinol-phosphatase